MKIENTKNKILAAAIKVFAENGFEGSRVDEIAKAAGVPKSLIYYHFRSKDEILEVLNDGLLAEYEKLILRQISGGETPEASGQSESPYMEFMEKNVDLIRVIFIESLKKSSKKPALFKVAETLLKAEGNAVDENTRNERLAAEFFTSIIPNLAFLCLKESWTENFNVPKKELDSIFLKIFQETHGAYHQKNDL